MGENDHAPGEYVELRHVAVAGQARCAADVSADALISRRCAAARRTRARMPAWVRMEAHWMLLALALTGARRPPPPLVRPNTLVAGSRLVVVRRGHGASCSVGRSCCGRHALVLRATYTSCAGARGGPARVLLIARVLVGLARRASRVRRTRRAIETALRDELGRAILDARFPWPAGRLLARDRRAELRSRCRGRAARRGVDRGHPLSRRSCAQYARRIPPAAGCRERAGAAVSARQRMEQGHKRRQSLPLAAPPRRAGLGRRGAQLSLTAPTRASRRN